MYTCLESLTTDEDKGYQYIINHSLFLLKHGELLKTILMLQSKQSFKK